MWGMARPSVPIYPGADVVRRLYVDELRSLSEIASIYDVTKSTSSKWLRKAGVQSRSIREGTMLSGKYGVHSESHRETLRRNAKIARSKVTPEGNKRGAEKRRGRPAPNRGVPMGEAQRKLLIEQRSCPEYRRLASERNMGDKASNWKGGVKPELARRLDRAEWSRIRREVYERDGWTCQECGCKCLNTADAKKHPKRKIQAHHIVSRRDGGLDELSNLVTLCMSCHHKLERAATR